MRKLFAQLWLLLRLNFCSHLIREKYIADTLIIHSKQFSSTNYPCRFVVSWNENVSEFHPPKPCYRERCRDVRGAGRRMNPVTRNGISMH